jgi:hypothetical protein
VLSCFPEGHEESHAIQLHGYHNRSEISVHTSTCIPYSCKVNNLS